MGSESTKTEVRVPKTVVSAPKTVVSAPKTVVSAPKTVVSGAKTMVSAPKTVVSAPKTEVSAPKTAVSAPKTAVSGAKTEVRGAKTAVAAAKAVEEAGAEVVFPPGAVLGPYTIVRRLAAGAMGVVYEAEHTMLRRRVALKTLILRNCEAESRAEQAERFVREARVTARLSHPGIVAIKTLDVEPKGQIPWFAMEFVAMSSVRRTVMMQTLFGDGSRWFRAEQEVASGEDLKSFSLEAVYAYAQAHGTHPNQAVIRRLLIEIADALHYAHTFGGGVIHRDIKPANILIRPDGHAVIADFGVAKIMDRALLHHLRRDDREVSLSLRIDASGEAYHLILGTRPYMAPELFEGAEPSVRTDMFAFGVMAYQLLTGHGFSGGAKRLSEHGYPSAWDRAIGRCLKPDPGDRWPDMQAVAGALRRLPDTLRVRRSHGPLPGWLAVGGAALLPAALFLGLLAALPPGTPGAEDPGFQRLADGERFTLIPVGDRRMLLHVHPDLCGTLDFSRRPEFADVLRVSSRVHESAQHPLTVVLGDGTAAAVRARPLRVAQAEGPDDSDGLRWIPGGIPEALRAADGSLRMELPGGIGDARVPSEPMWVTGGVSAGGLGGLTRTDALTEGVVRRLEEVRRLFRTEETAGAHLDWRAVLRTEATTEHLVRTQTFVCELTLTLTPYRGAPQTSETEELRLVRRQVVGPDGRWLEGFNAAFPEDARRLTEAMAERVADRLRQTVKTLPFRMPVIRSEATGAAAVPLGASAGLAPGMALLLFAAPGHASPTVLGYAEVLQVRPEESDIALWHPNRKDPAAQALLTALGSGAEALERSRVQAVWVDLALPPPERRRTQPLVPGAPEAAALRVLPPSLPEPEPEGLRSVCQNVVGAYPHAAPGVVSRPAGLKGPETMCGAHVWLGDEPAEIGEWGLWRGADTVSSDWEWECRLVFHMRTPPKDLRCSLSDSPGRIFWGGKSQRGVYIEQGGRMWLLDDRTPVLTRETPIDAQGRQWVRSDRRPRTDVLFQIEHRAEGVVLVDADVGTQKTLRIPSVLGGRRLLGIAEGAFAGNTTLETLDLPEALQFIGDRAFEGMTALRLVGVDLPIREHDSAMFAPQVRTAWGRQVFLNCTALQKVFFCSGFPPRLSDGLFEGCTQLQQVFGRAGSPYPSMPGGERFPFRRVPDGLWLNVGFDRSLRMTSSTDADGRAVRFFAQDLSTAPEPDSERFFLPEVLLPDGIRSATVNVGGRKLLLKDGKWRLLPPERAPSDGPRAL